MKKLMLVALLVLVPCVAFAEPFLVCDPYTDQAAMPTGFAYTLNGGAEVAVPYTTFVAQDGGTYAKIADLGPLPNGPFTISVRAYNTWGSSISVPFEDVKAVPGSPSNMGIRR